MICDNVYPAPETTSRKPDGIFIPYSAHNLWSGDQTIWFLQSNLYRRLLKFAGPPGEMEQPPRNARTNVGQAGTVKGLDCAFVTRPASYAAAEGGDQDRTKPVPAMHRELLDERWLAGVAR